MKPTVGRMVHFFPLTDCVGGGQSKIEKYAAIVTKVNDDGTLELATFGQFSLNFQHSVPMYGQKIPVPVDHQEVALAWGWAWPVREGE